LLNGNEDTALNLNYKYNLYDLLFIESNPIPVKWMLFKMNLFKIHIRLPLVELDETYHEKILSELYNLKLMYEKFNLLNIVFLPLHVPIFLDQKDCFHQQKIIF